MAETAVISTFLELRDRMSGGLRNAGAGLAKVGELARQAEGSLSKLNSVGNRVGLMLGGIAATWGGAAIISDVIKLNQEFEDTGIRIAGTIKAFNLAPTFDIAKSKAADAMKTIQDMAAALPGETEEYVSVFATALPKAVASGMTNLTDVAKFTSNWMALASSNMVDAQQAGMDLFRMLSGQAGADVRMFTVLAEKIGMSAEAFNKMQKKDPAQAVVVLQKVLGDYADQQTAAADSFSAKMGEFQSRIKEIKRLAGEILFERAKDALAEMNKWLSENRDTLIRTGRELFDKVIKGFELAAKAAKVLGENIGVVVGVSTTLIGLWVGGSLAGSILNLVNLFSAMRTAAVAAQGATAAATAFQATSGASSWIMGGAATAAKLSVGSMVVMSAGAVILAAGAAKMFADSLGEYAKAGAGMRAGFFGTADWEQEQFRTGRVGPKAAVGTVAELDARARAAAREALIFGGKYGGLQAQLERARFGDMPSYERTSGLAGGISELDAVREMYKQALVSPIKAAADDVVKFAESLGITKATLAEAGAVVKAPAATPKGRTEQKFDFRNSRFDIKQQFAEGFDPDRIAVSFSQDLARLGEMKLASGYAPLFGGK